MSHRCRKKLTRVHARCARAWDSLHEAQSVKQELMLIPPPEPHMRELPRSLLWHPCAKVQVKLQRAGSRRSRALQSHLKQGLEEDSA